ncbi:hypothetical protein OIO90_001259 [Microbotryomycetes sp. JL221]|nr:hypothetical protein OIO90_001259 [Microbotryomycetes sp. JL221]
MSSHAKRNSLPWTEPDSPTLPFDEDEPDLEGAVRNLSVSTDGTIESLLDESPTPPQSPGLHVHISPPPHFCFDDEATEEVLLKDPHATPTKIQLQRIPFFTGENVSTPRLVNNTEPSSPSMPALNGTAPRRASASDEGGLAARRAASGKLPNKALLSLQKMTFETPNASLGLGVGPGSAGFDVMDLSPGFEPQSNMAYRLTLEPDTAMDAWSPVLGSENKLDSPAGVPWTSAKLRRSPMPRSPGVVPLNDYFVLRSPRTQDRNLAGSASPQLGSPRQRSSPYSSPVMRSSAFMTNTGVLTPLTPSHLPPAPAIGGGPPVFDYFTYACPESPMPSDASSRSSYFLPTPGSESNLGIGSNSSNHPVGNLKSTQARRLPASPLGGGSFVPQSANAFFG